MVQELHTSSGIYADHNTLLVIEQNARLARKIRPLLHISGHRIVTVEGDEAFNNLIRAEHPALIVWVMGQHDTALALSQTPDAASQAGFLPILAITDRSTASHQADLIARGISEILTYPVDSEILLTRIHALLYIKTRFDALTEHHTHLVADLQEHNRQLKAALANQEETNLIKAALVSSVTHEMRTPVLQVKAAVSLLNEPPSPGTSNDTLLEMANQAIRRLEGTVQHITQITENQPLRLEPFALGDSVSLAIRNLARLWKAEDIDRISQAGKQPYPLVVGDKRGVAQVLQHLLENALKFDDNRGPVEILVKPGADKIMITVRDNGIGIPSDKLESIFLGFYQIDASSTRRYCGVGVGLTLAQHIARKMGSEITVRSTLSEGSAFTFELPAARL